MERLRKIQQALKVPKGKTNEFGHFKYRSAEDILEAVKPHLGDLSLVITSQAQNIGDWHYIVTIASLHGPNGAVVASSQAPAREVETRKGMDPAQCTGASLSYSKKYALGNLFAIDDGNDPDAYEGDDPRSSFSAPAGTVSMPTPPSSHQEPAGASFGVEDADFGPTGKANPAMGPEPELPPLPPEKAAPPKMPAPTAQQRQILLALSDFFRSQETDKLAFSKKLLSEKILARFRQWPNTPADAEQVKRMIGFKDIAVPR